MPLIYLIRHGRARFDDPSEADPGLDTLGHEQAITAADLCLNRLPSPLPLLTSPLRRCRETAAPLARRWSRSVTIEPRVRELPSPSIEPRARATWLAEVLPGNWQAMAANGESFSPGYARALSRWREGVRQAVLDCPIDSVVVTHFVVINSLVAEALAADSICNLRPDNGSITVIEAGRAGTRAIRLIEHSREMTTRIN